MLDTSASTLLQHGDIESNPGPKNKQVNNLVVTGMSVVYWLKIYLRFPELKHTTHPIVMISSVYQKATILGDKSFHLNGYNLLRVDHPNNIK